MLGEPLLSLTRRHLRILLGALLLFELVVIAFRLLVVLIPQLVRAFVWRGGWPVNNQLGEQSLDNLLRENYLVALRQVIIGNVLRCIPATLSRFNIKRSSPGLWQHRKIKARAAISFSCSFLAPRRCTRMTSLSFFLMAQVSPFLYQYGFPMADFKPQVYKDYLAKFAAYCSKVAVYNQYLSPVALSWTLGAQRWTLQARLLPDRLCPLPRRWLFGLFGLDRPTAALFGAGRLLS